ncbi:nuclease-related domain-containing DEAD/DEAH box helicase [Streptomyces mirabilis]|uniref:nuclease-related domain-containing DEAD/DEAH box helicase n=1 Tax=Streptomyces mirabilis TaxID=68239 RepID=UPI00367C2545
MIPPIIPPNAAPGERLVFERLASDPATRDWTVLHSLELAQHVRQVQGEADFVVIVPGKGIAVIEVKSHRQVTYDEQGWKLGSQRPTSRSPFKQADEAMHSVRSYLMSRNVQLRDTLFVSGVWFTHVRASLPASPEWHPWQILDRSDFGQGAGRAVLRLLDNGRAHHSGLRALPPTPGPDPQKTKDILKSLRPRVELATGSADLRRERNAQLTSFLEEQYDALDAMDGNNRVLFTGPAGSGKTFLALEASRRESARGKSGWLLCYNRALGMDLEKRATGAPLLNAGSLHSTLRSISGLDIPDDASDSFWQGDLVDAALEKLLDGGFERDFLIIDEVQDLAAPGYLDALDLMVKGGLAGGRCLFFGDFERQALYGLDDSHRTLTTRVSAIPTYTLTANCRNLPRIGETVKVLAAMSPGYRRFRRQDDGFQPRYYWYGAHDKQDKLLGQAIRDLRDDGFELDEIMVLSPRKAGSAAAVCRDSWLRRVLVEASRPVPQGHVGYSTIHAFKGLEAPAVILTDIDEPLLPQFEALLYVGLTRPRDRLSILATKEAIAPRVLGEQP